MKDILIALLIGVILIALDLKYTENIEKELEDTLNSGNLEKYSKVRHSAFTNLMVNNRRLCRHDIHYFSIKDDEVNMIQSLKRYLKMHPNRRQLAEARVYILEYDLRHKKMKEAGRVYEEIKSSRYEKAIQQADACVEQHTAVTTA